MNIFSVFGTYLAFHKSPSTIIHHGASVVIISARKSGQIDLAPLESEFKILSLVQREDSKRSAILLSFGYISFGLVFGVAKRHLLVSSMNIKRRRIFSSILTKREFLKILMDHFRVPPGLCVKRRSSAHA